MSNNEWLCINCGEVLGHVLGGELRPSVNGEQCVTRGPNLVITCPSCGSVKTFYTADPIVRAIYQLVDAISSELARRVLRQLSEGTLSLKDRN